MFSILRVLITAFIRIGWLQWLSVSAVMIGLPLLFRLLLLRDLNAVDRGSGDALDRDAFDAALFFLLYLGMGYFALTFAAMHAHQKNRQRLYTLPLSTRAITFWLMASTAVICLLGNLLFVSVYEFVFDIDWPIAVSSLVIVAAALMTQALYWSLLELNVPRLIQGIAIAATGIGYVGFRVFSDGSWARMHFWNQAEWYDWAVAGASIFAALVLGQRAIARDRCGDAESHSTLRAKFGQNIATSFAAEGTSSCQWDSPLAAQTWFEWKRLRRSTITIGVTIGIIQGLMLWRFSVSASNPIKATIALLIFIPALTGLIIGILMGDEAINREKNGASSWSDLPMKNGHLAGIALRANFKAIIVLWTIVAGCGIVFPAIGFIQRGVEHYAYEFHQEWFFKNLGWFGIPFALVVSFVATWTASALSACLLWTGRQRFVSVFVSSIVISVFLAFLLTFLFVERGNRQRAAEYLWMGGGIITFVGCVGLFARAAMSRVLDRRSIEKCALGWLGVVVLISCLPISTPARLTFAALAITIFTPVAAAPLAFGWNRHR
jgi:hypothetical protein